MQELLNDIELDVRELKCLAQAAGERPDEALCQVVCRSIARLKKRLDAVQCGLEARAAGNKTETPALEPEPLQAPESELPLVPPASPVAETPVTAAVPDPHETAPSSNFILAERIRPVADLLHAISLNDSFRFARELFDGDATRMNEVLARLSEASTLESALGILASEMPLEEDNQAAADLVELLHKYFV